MPTGEFNGTPLHYDIEGSGPPLVLVHGNPDDASGWDGVSDGFAETFRVVTYDRRGFGRNDPDPAPPTVERHVEDLAALIEALELAPAHVVGVSGGAIVAFRLAVRHPELVAGVAGHEPGFASLLADDPEGAAVLASSLPMMQEATSRLVVGDCRAASEFFVEGVLGEGGWASLSEESRERVVRNIPRFTMEAAASDAMIIDLEALAKVPSPLLLTTGATTTPLFAAIAERLADACPNLERHIFASGHTPHWTEPAEFVSVVTRWLTS